MLCDELALGEGGTTAECALSWTLVMVPANFFCITFRSCFSLVSKGRRVIWTVLYNGAGPEGAARRDEEVAKPARLAEVATGT